jgi:hypothetical protein
VVDGEEPLNFNSDRELTSQFAGILNLFFFLIVLELHPNIT